MSVIGGESLNQTRESNYIAVYKQREGNNKKIYLDLCVRNHSNITIIVWSCHNMTRDKTTPVTNKILLHY